VTSSDIVNRLRRLYGTRQVGHTGTLDPMATGVLPVLIGRAVKASDFILAENKRYTAGMRLGITTDTEDVTVQILTTASAIPDETAVQTTCAAFRGDIQQIPPMYSALKVDGKKLVDLARKGVTVERKPRPITIFKLEILEAYPETGEYRLDVACSKGTYMRTLCADIGAALGCGDAMCSLRRTRSGNFTIEKAISLETLRSLPPTECVAHLLPLSQVFADLPAVCLPPFFARLAKCGAPLYQKKIRTAHPIGQRVTLWAEDVFFALGEVVDTEDGTAIKPIKQFVLEG
jgi:tRNA pseudouridine55 synthase